MRGAGSETHIVVAAAGGGSQRILATRKSPLAFSFVAPDWSPDGKVVAASAIDRSNGSQSIVLLPVDGGSSRELYTSDGRIGRVRWLPDGSGLLTVVSEGLEEPRQFGRLTGGSIWRIGVPRRSSRTTDVRSGRPRPLLPGRRGERHARSRASSIRSCRISGLRPPTTSTRRRQLTSGHPVITRHSWLPDNDTIVYRDLSGRLNAVHKDGRAFSLPLPDGHKAVGGVSACGDGRYVVFQAVPGNNIWRVTPNAGGAVKLTSGFIDSNPACSPDGKWVLYSRSHVTTRPAPRSGGSRSRAASRRR